MLPVHGKEKEASVRKHKNALTAVDQFLQAPLMDPGWLWLLSLVFYVQTMGFSLSWLMLWDGMIHFGFAYIAECQPSVTQIIHCIC